MKKKFKMQNLDCAHCAEKMEAAIKKLDGVNDASVSFFAEKVMIDAEDDKFEAVLKQAVECVHKVNPDTDIVL
ncbi:MAG: cation transporter [Clostridiales bacterium]|nr:cation transporter [Candidatus Crickella equi]